MLTLLLLACTDEPQTADTHAWPEVTPGAPLVGAAEGYLELPVGTPLAGYSSRCGYLGGASKQDDRDSSYATAFSESTGVQTLPQIKSIWLENGDDHLVLVRFDVIYSYDELVAEVTRQLEEATGERLDGKVVITTNHSHASWANFSDQTHFYLGGDRYHEENFRRTAAQLAEVALEAYQNRVEAAVGASWTKDWDPNDEVYRDRRGENDELAVWDDVEPGYGKDPYLHVLRFDTLDGDPIAFTYTFGIHGTSLGDDNPMVSIDAPGHLDTVIQEQFDEHVVVMHMQGAGGDASPSGVDSDYARLESVGERAADKIVAAWESTPTSSADIRMETVSRHIPQLRDTMSVTRDYGELVYAPYDPDAEIDNEVWDGDQIITPIDEFNTQYGGAFCGAGDPDDPDVLIPGFDVGATVYPYSSCVDVEAIGAVLGAIFRLEDWEVTLPLPESLAAHTTASRIGPLTTLTHEGETVDRDLLAGFFPAEPLGMFAEQWRRRVAAETGYEQALLVGYAQDHEGYFLIPEDWLAGGYEPNINVWGPLQAEHVMEGVIEVVATVLSTDVHEDPDPLGWYPATEYFDRDLPTEQPDTTPDAGERLTAFPEYFWTPLDLTPSLDIPSEVPRVTGMVQLAWEGGDPAVDLPDVVLQREVDGSWVDATSHSGRRIDTAQPDILLGHTPDPLFPSEADQVHRWWAGWQAVSHVRDRAGLELGTYRLKVTGERYTGGSASWPWATESYEVLSDTFTVVPAELSVSLEGDQLTVALQAPEDGYRLIHLDGSSRGSNPVVGPVTVTWGSGASEEVEVTASGGVSVGTVSGGSGEDQLIVYDAYGNSGTVSF